MAKDGSRSPTIPVVLTCSVLSKDGEFVQQVQSRVDSVDERGAGKHGDDSFTAEWAFDDARGVRHRVPVQVSTEIPPGTAVEFPHAIVARLPPEKVVIRDAEGRIEGVEERWLV